MSILEIVFPFDLVLKPPRLGNQRKTVLGPIPKPSPPKPSH
jgi:hypothetical protein